MILQQLITGVSIGSVYALLAVGYALVFSVFNFSNFGFGPVMMLGHSAHCSPSNGPTWRCFPASWLHWPLRPLSHS